MSVPKTWGSRNKTLSLCKYEYASFFKCVTWKHKLLSSKPNTEPAEFPFMHSCAYLTHKNLKGRSLFHASASQGCTKACSFCKLHDNHQFSGFKIKPSRYKALLVPFTSKPLIEVGNTKWL